MNSIRSQRTIPSWYQEVIELYDIDRKLDTLSDNELITMKREFDILKDAIELASENEKELNFVLNVLSPRAAVYPIIKTSMNHLIKVIENLEQLHFKMEKKITLEEQKEDWNLLVELKNSKLLHGELGRMKGSKGVKYIAKKKRIRFTKKDFLIIFIFVIFILVDPFGLFPLI